MGFSLKLEGLQKEAREALNALIPVFGIKSRFSAGQKILPVNSDDFALSGENTISEISSDSLICSDGHAHYDSALSIDTLFTVIDNVIADCNNISIVAANMVATSIANNLSNGCVIIHFENGDIFVDNKLVVNFESDYVSCSEGVFTVNNCLHKHFEKDGVKGVVISIFEDLDV